MSSAIESICSPDGSPLHALPPSIAAETQRVDVTQRREQAEQADSSRAALKNGARQQLLQALVLLMIIVLFMWSQV